MRCLRRISSAVDQGLTSLYRSLGRFIARRPWAVITITVAVALACAVGFIRFTVEEDAEKLYTPQNAPSFEDKAYVDAYYPSDSLSVKLLSLSTQDGGNVLTKEHLLEHLRAYTLATTQTVETKGVKYAYADVCDTVSEQSTECRVDSVLAFWNYNETALKSDPNILATLNRRDAALDYLGRPVNLNWVLGGVRRDASGAVVAAECLQSVLFMKYGSEFDDAEDSPTVVYQERIVEVCYDGWSSAILAQYVSCDAAVGRESTDAINRDVSRLTVGYVLLIIYTLVVLWRNSWAYQKVHVALGSFIAIGMGIAASFGMLSGFGLEFNFVCQVLPFLLVGVGVDNTFVIVSNYFDQDPDAPIEHRLGEALALAGSSITVSCMTNVIAFAVGTYTSLEALLSFSVYASIGVLMVFIFQVTAFPAFLALDARRELRKRLGAGGCGGCCVAPCCCQSDPVAEQLQHGSNGWTLESNIYKHNHDGAAGNALEPTANSPPTPHGPPKRSGSSTPSANASTGDLNVKVSVRPPSPDSMKQQAFVNEAPAPASSPRDFSTPTITCWGKRVFNPHDDQLSTKIIARWLPRVSLALWGKVLVIVLECVFLGFAIYGCTKVYQDFNFREMFVPEGNWLHEAFQVEDRYFGGEKVPVAAYTRLPNDGRDYFYYQDQLAALGQKLGSDPYITDVPPVNSWYDDYQKWLNSSAYAGQLVNGRAPNETAFNGWLKEWLRTDGRASAGNIVLNATTGRIVSTRFPAFTKDVVDGAWAIKCVDSTRDTVTAAAPDLNTIAFGYSYTFWDGFRSITFSTITNVIIAAAAVFLVTLLLLADVLAALVVGCMVVLCDVGVLGSMHYLGLTFNSVTCIVLVLAVGISVDYSAHVMRAFLVSTGTRQERAHKALVEIGGAVWNGAITTFLAVLPMAAAEHYIFTTVFQMFAILILLSIWHGVVLLPVLCSFAGPASYRDQDSSQHGKKDAVVEMA
ncbi:hypothetical protein HYH02_015000 [Chlamydomonas schloesseri]|uniref:SSD domain-containing protein n=1 Tax=Chlamydomonas schloesseri TaxID=2026947 RepID=A0A835SLE3_9CHLO|nr:hypothetical protein HYH02_015000 [Chlamydomonas schloesseri]|eukprot:KAG2425628.1 hypothetical protein HYH02_015000 [Chlamydomonas schloesseri]